MTVASNLIPTRLTELAEYGGSDDSGYTFYVLGGVTYKVRFGNLVSVSQVPTTRTITAGTGLSGGGDLSANRTLTANLSNSNPAALGVVSPGFADFMSRYDHVHPALNLSDATQTSSTLLLSRGGTGGNLTAVHGGVVYSGASALAVTGAGTPGQVLMSNGANAPIWNTVTGTGTVSSVSGSGGTTGLTLTGGPITGIGTLTIGGTLIVANGGTGAATLTGYVKGNGTSAFTAAATVPASDISSGAALTRVDDTNVTLTLGGTPSTALLAAASLTLGWTGTLAVARGGSGAATLTGYLKGNGTSAFTASATVPASDISSGAALTRVDDTNVTLTLGGTPGSALLAAASLTLGWTGTLAASRGGTNNGFFAVSGPATSAKTFTFPNASATVLTDNAAVTVLQGGTGQTSYTNGQLLIGNTTGNTLDKATLTAGAAIIVTNGGGSISIATPITTEGDLIIGNGANSATRLAIGANNTVLTSNGATASWVAAGASLLGQTDSASPFETALGSGAGTSSTGVDNTFVGYNSGTSNTTGTDNTAVGYQALGTSVSSTHNTAVGANALLANSAGADNVAVGSGALDANTTGTGNVGAGRNALGANTTGTRNTAVGFTALGAAVSALDNTAVGYNALAATTTGANNVAVGSGALDANTTGSNNIGMGVDALGVNTTGANNTAIGHQSLDANTIGTNNTAVGSAALGANTTGVDNTAIGSGALDVNTVGTNNTAVGKDALGANTTGIDNTAVGSGALDVNTIGTGLVAVGRDALGANTTGVRNVAVGMNALKAAAAAVDNTAIGYNALTASTGGANNTAVGAGALDVSDGGSDNTAVGKDALGANTTGVNNTAVGVNALVANTIGTSNVSVGRNALAGNTTGVDNVAVGTTAGFSIAAGTQNTFVGAIAGTTLISGSNNTVLGYDAEPSSATVSNEITLGNASVATLRCQVTTITALSDARDKANIQDIPLGLDFIGALRPRMFDWNQRDGANPGKVDFGFIAQELDEAEQKAGYADYTRLVYKGNPDRWEATPGQLLPIMVKAIQELSAKVAALEAKP